MYYYFDVAHAVEVHDTIIEKSGGLSGVLNIGLLESILAHVQNDEYYPSIEDKAAHLFFAINKNHSFQDGNKRSSLALTAYFLEINGFGFCLNNFLKEMENITVDIADNRIDKSLLFRIIKSLLSETELSDELKLEIIKARDINNLWE